MTTGSGLYISPVEKNPISQNKVIQSLIEGRSNAVGKFTLTHDGSATTTTVTAVTCGPNSIVVIEPTTANALTAKASAYVSSVTPQQFVVTHAATSNADETFWFHAVG